MGFARGLMVYLGIGLAVAEGSLGVSIWGLHIALGFLEGLLGVFLRLARGLMGDGLVLAWGWFGGLLEVCSGLLAACLGFAWGVALGSGFAQGLLGLA